MTASVLAYGQSVQPEGEPQDLVPVDSVVAEDPYRLPVIDSTYFIVREIPDILDQLGDPDFEPTPVNKVLGPWVFSGYRALTRKSFDLSTPVWLPGMEVMTNVAVMPDSVGVEVIETQVAELPADAIEALAVDEVALPDYRILHEDVTPKWLRDALTAYRIQEDFMYSMMIARPGLIEYSYWGLPERPKLPEEEVSFAAYIRKLELPDVGAAKADLPDQNIRRIYWLHTFNSSAQFSQAYVSKNWYQGGNNHMSLLFNVGWNVQLNQVFYPNLLLQSNLQYKLGLYSTPDDQVHDYSISEDVLQYNLNAGVKAFKKWYYSLNMQFKTQLFNNFKSNSNVRKASFLSPGDFNVGLGMSYNTANKKKTFQLTATVAPISYNLKTCIADNSKIGHEQFNISPDRKSHSEIGSNGEVVVNWNIAWNINYKTRFFAFTDYKYFLSDWENTVSFNVNKFLSTQIYVHMRYDSSTDTNTKWKHFMLREILSFGLTYTFSTKP